MVSGIGIVTYLENVNYEKKDKSGVVDGVLVHCVVPDVIGGEDPVHVQKVCRCWCSNKPNSIVNGLVLGDKVEIRYGKYGEYIMRVLPKEE